MAKLQISSAGTNAKAGKQADPRAIAAARELGVNLDSHRAQPVTREMLEQTDLIIAMDFVNEAKLIALAPEADGKIFMLGALDDGEHLRPIEIADPYDGELSDVRRCYAAMDTPLSNLARELRARTSG